MPEESISPQSSLSRGDAPFLKRDIRLNNVLPAMSYRAPEGRRFPANELWADIWDMGPFDGVENDNTAIFLLNMSSLAGPPPSKQFAHLLARLPASPQLHR